MMNFIDNAYCIYNDTESKPVATIHDKDIAFDTLAFLQDRNPNTIYLLCFDESKIVRYKDGEYGYLRN